METTKLILDWTIRILFLGIVWFVVGRWMIRRYLTGTLVFHNWVEAIFFLITGPYSWWLWGHLFNTKESSDDEKTEDPDPKADE